MKEQKNLNFLKILQDTITFRWLKKSLLIVPMVLSVIIGFVITIYWLLKLLLRAASYPFAILNIQLTSILIQLLEHLEKISFLLQIQIQCTLHLTNSLVKCLEREQRLKKSSTSWILWPEKKLNHLLIKVIRFSLDM